MDELAVDMAEAEEEEEVEEDWEEFSVVSLANQKHYYPT